MQRASRSGAPMPWHKHVLKLSRHHAHSRARASRRKYLWRVERWQFQRRGDSQVGLTDPTVRIDLDIGRPLAHVLSAASTLSSRAVPSRQLPHARRGRSLDERNVMQSCMFGLSARSFGQETVYACVISVCRPPFWLSNAARGRALGKTRGRYSGKCVFV